MSRFAFSAALLALASATVVAQDKGPPTVAFDITAAEVQAILEAPTGGGDRQMRVVDMGKYNVSVGVLTRGKTTPGAPVNAIAHAHVTEVYYIVSGEGTLLTGGEVENVKAFPADTEVVKIAVGASNVGTFKKAAQTRKVGPGDIVIIPPGVYHGFSDVADHVDYVSVRPDPDHVLPAGYVHPLIKEEKFAAQPAASLDPVIRGAIDLHSHLDPDGFGPGHNGRALDVMEMAALARAAGMRGFVIKMHYDQTADDAYLVRKQFPNLEVFGGIGTNFATGGLNPAAIRQMAEVKGGWGRVVWMPTWDAKHYVEHNGNNRPFITVAKNGELVPEAKAVLATIAEVNGKTRGSKGNIIVATGHNSPEEVLLITREARRLGLNVLITHPLLDSVGMNIQQMQEAVKMGAYLEFVTAFTRNEKTTLEYVEAIRKIGPQYCIVSSDKGQGRGEEGHDAPAQSPVEGLSEAAQVLRKHGFKDADLALMFRTNPAKLLGLPVE